VANAIVDAVHRRFRQSDRTYPRVAWLSPMPPAKTGIASYSMAVLDGLERMGYTPTRRRIEPVWPLRPRHEDEISRYALAVYHLGNHVEFHRDIYRHAIRTPGVVVIHDLALDGFFHGMISAGDPLGHQAEREGLAHASLLASLPDVVDSEPLRVPLIAHVARRARGIVVHSEFGRRYLHAFGCRTPVFVAPHPTVESGVAIRHAEDRRALLRGGLEAQGMRTLVGVFGDLNAPKLIDTVCEAVHRLPESVHLALVGRISGFDVEGIVASSGLGGRVTLLSDVSDEDFLAWMCAADVSVNLRFPHRGEVSGTLARAMQCGRPAIVSGTGTYLDIPDDVVVRVSPGRVEAVELASAIERLVERPELRAAIGERASRYMAELARGERTAHVYADAIDQTLTLLADPGRRALARWGGALADLGATSEHVRLGYGLAYARALEELAPPGGPGG
jgi:glycosyltransferase involved in cell wall biosynthesis